MVQVILITKFIYTISTPYNQRWLFGEISHPTKKSSSPKNHHSQKILGLKNPQSSGFDENPVD